MVRIRSPQDLGAAITLFLIGVGGWWFGREYDLGTISAMGPGYMPMLLSVALIFFSLVIGIRAFVIEGPPMARPLWRPVILILASIALFALLIRMVGLLPTTFIVTVVAAAASAESRRIETLALAVGLAIFCVLVFIYGLGQSMSVIGAE